MLLTITTERGRNGIRAVIRNENEIVVQTTANYDDKRDAYRAAKELRETLINIAKCKEAA
jgi:hypothetical protein